MSPAGFAADAQSPKGRGVAATALPANEEQAEGPEPGRKPSATRHGSGAGRRAGLSDADKARVCSSAEAMRAWINSGPLNFQQYVTNDVIDTGRMTTQAFAGVYWAGVCDILDAERQPLRLPDTGRLCRAIDGLRATMTSDDTYRFVRTMLENWDTIREKLRNLSIPLGEGTLQHSLVQAAVQDIIAGQARRTVAMEGASYLQ